MASIVYSVCSALFLIVLVASASALPKQDEARSGGNSIQTEDDLLNGIYADCLKKDSIACVKYKLFSFVDKVLGQKDTITVTDGLTIIKTGEPEGAPRSLDGDDSIESLFFSRLQRFLDSHTIKVDIKGSDLVNAVSSGARSLSDLAEEDFEEGRRGGGGGGFGGGGGKKGGKKGGNMGPLMALVGLKTAMMGKIALAVIAMIAGKALIVGKIALVLAAIIGLKSLMGGQRTTTYDVVAHPHHSVAHVDHGVHGGGGSGYGGGDVGYGGGAHGGGAHGGGWARASEGHQLAYRGQQPAMN